MLDFEQVGDRRRTVTLENGNKLHFQSTDPYGFWTVHYDKGQLPLRLQGVYTSFDAALRDVEAYITSEKKKPVKGQMVENAA